MARPLRIELAGGFYHVTSRGDRRDDIFDDDADRISWLELFGNVCQRFNWRCHAYCLMDNHYHIVIETAEANLSKGMRQLNGVYTQNYNRRHGRVGHVFQGRYKAILVERDRYLLELSRYVVLNPVRAGMVKKIAAWKWSNYHAMLGNVSAPAWLETDWVLGQLSKTRKKAIEGYIQFVCDGVGLPSVWKDLQGQVFLGGDKFIKRYQQYADPETQINEIPALQRRPKAKPIQYYDKKCRHRNQAILLAFSTGRYTLKEIGEYFNLHYSTVSRIVKNQNVE